MNVVITIGGWTLAIIFVIAVIIFVVIYGSFFVAMLLGYLIFLGYFWVLFQIMEGVIRFWKWSRS